MSKKQEILAKAIQDINYKNDDLQINVGKYYSSGDEFWYNCNVLCQRFTINNIDIGYYGRSGYFVRFNDDSKRRYYITRIDVFKSFLKELFSDMSAGVGFADALDRVRSKYPVSRDV